MKCPFCNPEANERQRIVLQNKFCLFLQKAPKVLVGSGIIIPRAHREDVFQLTRREWKATFSLLKKAKKILDEKYQPDGYNVGWNTGVAGGQDIFHAHLHVIPRFADEPLAGKGIRYWIKQNANKRSNRSS